MDLQRVPTIVLAGGPGLIEVFAGLLQEGIGVQCRTGIDLETLLMDEFGIEPDYIARRISTIFVNGSCVDSLGDAVVHDGDILALSASMPGLVGATLRRGGILASMRSGITLAPEAADHAPSRGVITLKLFNTLIAELGSLFLRRGVVVDRARLIDGLGASSVFRDRCDRATVDGRDVPAAALAAELAGAKDDLVLLKVTVPE